jgi:hypothetical protein
LIGILCRYQRGTFGIVPRVQAIGRFFELIDTIYNKFA